LKPKAIIYDCDGVLIDSRRSNEAFYNHILTHFGLPRLSKEQLDRVHVSTAQEAVSFLFEGSPRLAEAQDFQRRVDNRPFMALLRLEPHVIETLTRLRPAFHTAIATNRGRSLPLVLETFGLTALFDLTVSCYDVQRPKPHPECLEKVLAHFSLAPQAAIYIGDAEVDRQVAAAAGMPFVAYKNQTLKADYHLEDHLDLLKLLSVSNAGEPG
jgi:phosphoglycolate phosphatase